MLKHPLGARESEAQLASHFRHHRQAKVSGTASQVRVRLGRATEFCECLRFGLGVDILGYKESQPGHMSCDLIQHGKSLIFMEGSHLWPGGKGKDNIGGEIIRYKLSLYIHKSL